jgi:hypothetical protein
VPSVGHVLGLEDVEAIGRKVVGQERACSAMVLDDEDRGGVLIHVPKSRGRREFTLRPDN